MNINALECNIMMIEIEEKKNEIHRNTCIYIDTQSFN